MNNKKSLASKLTDKDMEVDVQAIFEATEEKFRERQRKAELGKLQNPFEH